MNKQSADGVSLGNMNPDKKDLLKSNLKAMLVSFLFLVAAYHMSKYTLTNIFQIQNMLSNNSQVIPVQQLLLAVISLIIIRSAYLMASGFIFFRISKTTANTPILILATAFAIYGILVVDIDTPVSMHIIGVVWTYLCVFFGFKLGKRFSAGNATDTEFGTR